MARFALCDEELQPQAVTTSLGVTIESELTWREHVKKMRQKCFVGLTKHRRIGRNVPMTTLKMLYSALILPHVDYCSVVWDQLTKDLERKVETIKNVGIRMILNAPRGIFPLRQFSFRQFPLCQFPFGQLPTLPIPTLSIPTSSTLIK